MEKKIKISLTINIIIFFMVLVGTIFMITGFKFMGSSEALAATGLSPFKFYTVDSNLLAGLASAILIAYEILFLDKKIKNIPKYAYVLKYVSVVGVSLTFLVTLFYLAPAWGSKFWFLYQNSNLFFHLLVPLLSFISFVFYEKVELDFKYSLLGISTMVIYGIYYTINILIHQQNGMVSYAYDWYGFVQNGVSFVCVVFLIITMITYALSLLIIKINNK